MCYPIQFRKQVFKIKREENLNNKEVAKRFGIGSTTLYRWEKRLMPKLKRNKPATHINMDKLKQDLEKYPDGYHYERAERLGVSKGCVRYALERLKITRKKKHLNIPKEMKNIERNFYYK